MARYRCGWTGVGENVEEGGGGRGSLFRAEEAADEGERRKSERSGLLVWSDRVWSGFWLLCFPARGIYTTSWSPVILV